MRPDVVLVAAPEGQLSAGIGQFVEDLPVQAFVAQAALKDAITPFCSGTVGSSECGQVW
jgi:hypothetical protein